MSSITGAGNTGGYVYFPPANLLQTKIIERKAEHLVGAERQRYDLYYNAFAALNVSDDERNEAIRSVLAGTYEFSELYEGMEEKISAIKAPDLLAAIEKRLGEEIGHEQIESEIDLMAIRDYLKAHIQIA